ncbi:MAG: hypothetical protein AAB921_02300 [Patescibacteria group bacterium]
MLKNLLLVPFGIATAMSVAIAFKAGQHGFQTHDVPALVGSGAMTALAIAFALITARFFVKWVKEG